MKKILLGTSAVVGAALMASTASAQDPIQIGIGGNLNSALTIDWQGGSTSSHEDEGSKFDNDGLNLSHDWDLDFAGSTTLENGLTIGVFIELDEGGGNPNTDEVYVSVSGGFGTFLVGNLGAAGDQDYGNINGGSLFAIGDGTFDLGGSGSVDITPLDRDVVGIGEIASLAYQTPSLAGFTATLSYSPDNSEMGDSDSQPVGAGAEDVFSFALEYDNSFGSVDVSAGAAMTYANGTNTSGAADLDGNGGDDAGQETIFINGRSTTIQYTNTVNSSNQNHFSTVIGAELGFAGFTFGGGYSYGSGVGSGDYESRYVWSAGLGYAIDQVSVGGSFMWGAGDVAGGGTDRAIGLQLDGAYALGPGITVGAGFGMTNNNYSAATGENDVRSYGFGTSLAIGF